MATAAELLADVLEVDKTLVVDNDFRIINIPSSVPNLGVEHDDDVLRLEFKMPRYVSNTDLNGFNIRINYINANGESDVYTVKDPVVAAQHITFTWLVGPTATRYKGNTKFNICAKTLKDSETEVDENGKPVKVIDREFNTTIATLPVLEGLEVDEGIVEEYSDIIAQWQDDLFGTKKNSVINEITNTGTESLNNLRSAYNTFLDSIPDEYEDVKSKADAIICKTQGEVIAATDSSNNYIRGLRVFGKTTQVTTTGKNLIDDSEFNEGLSQGVYFSRNNDGSFTASGVATTTNVAIIRIGTINMTAGTKYIITGAVDHMRLSLRDETMGSVYADDAGEGTTYVPAENMLTHLYARVEKGDSISATFYPMVRMESVSDPTWEPCSGGLVSPTPDNPRDLNNIENHTAFIYGHNIFPVSEITAYNVTGTPQADGSVNYVGTSDGNAWHAYQDCPLSVSGKYTLTIHTTNKTNKGALIQLFNSRNDIIKSWISVEDDHVTVFDGEAGGKLRWNIGVEPDEVVKTNVKLMVNVGDKALPWEPYSGKQSINTTRVLAGIPVTTGGNYTDENGQQWVCDEVDFERGVYIQRVYALVSDYNSSWKISGNSTTNHNAFYRMNTSLPTMIKGTNQPVVCTHFTTTRDPVADHVTCVSGGLSNQEVYFFVPKTEFPDVETWTNYVVEQANAGTPITTYYILNEPIETPLSAEEIAAFKALHTNYPNTTVLNDAGATMELKYNADTKTYIENLPGASEEDIANAVEDYLEENPIDIPDIDLDTTLSKSGQAADAKAVGDKIGSIETALDSIIEIQNSLIGGDGA